MRDGYSEDPGMEPNSEMTTIGYIMGLLLAVIMLPLVPYYLVYWVVDRLTGAATPDRAGDTRLEAHSRGTADAADRAAARERVVEE